MYVVLIAVSSHSSSNTHLALLDMIKVIKIWVDENTSQKVSACVTGCVLVQP